MVKYSQPVKYILLLYSFSLRLSAIFMPPFEKGGAYCFAHVGRSVCRSVCRYVGIP